MRISRHYVTGSLLQNDSASCPRSAASEAVSANAMVLTTAPQHNAAPPNVH
ncbi:lipoate--protein ligase [Vibrio cholerae]|nr:lipoate--protein ligase [Vibrio cholerae]